jgi:UTP--glucose-1-phosphate uridylyltransferase
MSTPPAPPPSINRAIIPAAGLGTRLKPLTNAIPKEMLPLGRKPVLEHVVDELKTAGIVRLLFVVSPGKEMVRRYFGDGSAWGLSCEYAVQTEMKGLGDAILHGAEWAHGEPAVIAFGDCVVKSDASLATTRLIHTHTANGATATVLTESVPREKTAKYGIVKPAGSVSEQIAEPFPCADIVEKPAPQDAPSTWAVAARWVLQPEIMEWLRRARPGADGEVNLTDSVREAVRNGAALWAAPLQRGERRRDIGGWETYLTAAVEYAMMDPEVGDRLRSALCAEVKS